MKPALSARQTFQQTIRNETRKSGYEKCFSIRHRLITREYNSRPRHYIELRSTDSHDSEGQNYMNRHLMFARRTALALTLLHHGDLFDRGTTKNRMQRQGDAAAGERRLPVCAGRSGHRRRTRSRTDTRKSRSSRRTQTLCFSWPATRSHRRLSRSLYKGAQMIDAWNTVGLDYATFGNHEFDFGPDVLKERIKESKFAWVAANVIDKTTNKTIRGCAAICHSRVWRREGRNLWPGPAGNKNNFETRRQR